jgi:hypothetical protein
MKDQTAFHAALDDHTRAIETFLSAARRVPEADWPRPVAPDKWSPGQIAEHLALSLEAVARELSGGRGMRYRMPWWKRFVAKRRYLPGILRSKRFPSGARAPRETRPSAAAAPQTEALARLRAANAAIERIAAADPRTAGRRLRHPYFGRLSAADLFAVIALHADHHRGQLPVS